MTRTDFHCRTVSGDLRLDSGFPLPRLEPVAASESFKKTQTKVLEAAVAQFTFHVTMATDAGEPREERFSFLLYSFFDDRKIVMKCNVKKKKKKAAFFFFYFLNLFFLFSLFVHVTGA